jgi:hypothetical protein
MRRIAPLALVWTLLALGLGVAAAGAAPPAGLADGPSLSTMALGPNDFASARVVSQGHREAGRGAVAVYTRDFAPGARAERSPLLSAWNEVALLVDETAARSELAAIRSTLASPGGRAAVGRSFKTGFTRSAKLRITSLTVSRPTTLGIGVDSLRFAITFKTRVGRFHVAYAFVRVDRAIGQIVLLGHPGKIIAAGDVKRLAVAQRERFRKGFTITRGEVAVTGTAAQGSTLGADHVGRWDGGPSEFAYQWSRCDSAGVCTSIPGAVGQTYTVTAEDAGKTLKVTVTGKNSVSTFTAESGQTTAVA